VLAGEPSGSGSGSGDDGDVPPGRFAEMPLELDGDTLTIEPDQQLLTDPRVEFPILIDPPFAGKRLHWATVHQQQPGRGWTDDKRWPRDGGMRVGRLGYWPGYPCGDACGLWRSVIRFDTTGLRGRQIVSAAVKAVQSHTSGCGEYPLQLWHVDPFTSGASWNTINSRWNGQLQSRTPVSSNRSGGCSGTLPAGVTYDASAVRNLVQDNADADGTSLSFGFRSADESSISPYRRIAVDSVRLEVEYNRPAQTPTNLNTDGHGCGTSAPGPWLTTKRPTLSGKPRDPDGRVGAHLQIRRIGSSSTHYSWTSATSRTHNTVVNHRIPADRGLGSGAYRWRMRSLDSHAQGTDSAWREWCYFRVDVTSPVTPTVRLAGPPPQAGQPATLELVSQDTHSGLGGFHIGVSEEVKRDFTAAPADPGQPRAVTVTVPTPSSGGRTWVYVWSRDQAGNTSNPAVFDVFAARFVAAVPAAAWRLSGDGVDDSGQGHDLALGGGFAWEDDGGPPADRSAGFDGTGCVGTDGPVLRLDSEYTVAAWVRLDDKTIDRHIMAQAGQVRAGFYFKYQQSTDRWYFSLASEDAREDVSWATIRSTDPAVAGRWTHLAARVDPAASHIQLYVNGALDGERDIPHIPWHVDGAMSVGCAARTSGHTWSHMDGAIHHAAAWQGLLTPAQIQAAYSGELPAGLTGDWRLRGDGADASAHVRDVTVSGTAGWTDDQHGRARSALRLTGAGWAEAAPAVVRTDRSFSVAAWVRLDAKGGFGTVVSQTAVNLASFNLNYHPDNDRWQFSMPSQDGTGATWHRAQSTTVPAVGRWYHLAGVFDRHSGQMRLYVDGALERTVAGPAQPWHEAGGELLVGATGFLGERSNRLVGAVAGLRSWRGALTDGEVAAAYGGNPAVRWLSQWSLDGTGADDVGGHPLTLVGAEGVDYEWVEDRACFPFSALGLQLDGQGHARTAGAMVVTDESFTVTAWVRLDALAGGHQTVLSQGGIARSAFHLQVSPDGRWRFAMPQQDSASPAWAVAQSAAGAVVPGAWTHLAGVFDLARGEVRLYVDGELAGTAATASPWAATGPLYLGAAGTAGGGVSERMRGAIDTVTVWSSTLDPDRIADMAVPAPFGGGPCFL
jgi:hypothetical protein